MAKTNLFQKGDLVTTEYGPGVIIKNCAECEFWQINIAEVGSKKLHYTKIELRSEKDGRGN